jgi:trans-2,3-dihydro-3-hydroxyanthranilate isomerase
MPSYPYITVDVFTERQFGGNPLAVVSDARGLSDEQMQQLAAEFNYSETTFVLPPEDPAHTARVRIFNRTHEMPFAGHPNVGTALVLAWTRTGLPDRLVFEETAGLVTITLERGPNGAARGASINAPQPLTTGLVLPVEDVATCLGINPAEIRTEVHPPLVASVGMPFVVAEVSPAGLAQASPNLEPFKAVVRRYNELEGRLSIFFYSRIDRRGVRARMFGPLAGTWEDPATGSASAALVALLLSRSGDDALELDITQGVEMGRTSRIGARAWRTAQDIRSAVKGESVIVFRGEVVL